MAETELERLRRELAEVREQRDDRERWWRQAGDERDAALKSLTEQAEELERQRDQADRAWEWVERHAEAADAAEAALEEERRERDALIELAVERRCGAPTPRGRPPVWRPESEDEVERQHRAGATVRQLASELGMSKTRAHQIIARARARHAADASGRASPRSPPARARHSVKPG